MNFTQTMENVTRLFEVLGVGVILVGLLVAAYQAVVLMTRGCSHLAYEKVRSTFGRSVLLGLELLVAGDIIRTVALDPTLDNLLVLGLLVVIRTFLSWSLEVEIDGRWPWQAAAAAKPEDKEAQTRP
jgi:uncharacterized membrane protein